MTDLILRVFDSMIDMLSSEQNPTPIRRRALARRTYPCRVRRPAHRKPPMCLCKRFTRGPVHGLPIDKSAAIVTICGVGKRSMAGRLFGAREGPDLRLWWPSETLARLSSADRISAQSKRLRCS